jgi:molybdopterin-guanine dinucleotide biosynthesis protein A
MEIIEARGRNVNAEATFSRSCIFKNLRYDGRMKKLFRSNGNPLNLIVLAGGSSRRMKKDKALLPVDGTTLIEYIIDQVKDRFAEILISVSNPAKFDFLPYEIVVDERPGLGPMMGIQSALQVSSNERNFIIGCDIPKVNLSFVEDMVNRAGDAEIVVPVSEGRRLEPLFAIYSKTVQPEMKKLLDSGTTSLLPLFEVCQTHYMTIEKAAWFKNLNTTEDYQDFLKQIRKKN